MRLLEKNYRLHIFDQQGDKVGKEPTSERSTTAPEEEINKEELFLSTNPIQTIKRILI